MIYMGMTLAYIILLLTISNPASCRGRQSHPTKMCQKEMRLVYKCGRGGSAAQEQILRPQQEQNTRNPDWAAGTLCQPPTPTLE